MRQTLIADLLSANNLNLGVRQYFQLLGGDFLEFANQEDSLKDEAAAFLELQAIGDELKVIGAYPEFYKNAQLPLPEVSAPVNPNLSAVCLRIPISACLSASNRLLPFRLMP